MENINVKGKFQENSDISCNNFKVNGKVQINGDICVQESINVLGKITAGNIKSNSVIIKGNLLTKSMKCCSLNIQGKIVARNIKSDEISISASENSSIDSVEANKIKIIGTIANKEIEKKIVEKFLNKFSLSIDNSNIAKKEKCSINTIHGDEISLQNVKVKNIICRKAEILDDCEIESLIYSEAVDICNNSTVIFKEQKAGNK